jgi:hypothetical protein
MKFDLNDLRKLVKEEMNRRAVLKEVLGGIYPQPLNPISQQVMDKLRNPDPNSKTSQDIRLQKEKDEMRKSLLNDFTIALANEINRLGDEEEKTLKFKLRQFVNNLASKFGVDLVFKNLEETVEPSGLFSFINSLNDIEKRQLFMQIYHQILPMLETNEDLNVLDWLMSKISEISPKLANDLGDFVRDTDGKPRR